MTFLWPCSPVPQRSDSLDPMEMLSRFPIFLSLLALLFPFGSFQMAITIFCLPTIVPTLVPPQTPSRLRAPPSPPPPSFRASPLLPISLTLLFFSFQGSSNQFVLKCPPRLRRASPDASLFLSCFLERPLFTFSLFSTHILSSGPT